MHIWSIKGNVSGNLILIRKVAICAKLQENRKVLKYIGIDFTAKNFHFCQNETLHNAEFLWQLSNLQTSVKKLSQNIWFPPSPPQKKEKLLYDWQRKKTKKLSSFTETSSGSTCLKKIFHYIIVCLLKHLINICSWKMIHRMF